MRGDVPGNGGEHENASHPLNSALARGTVLREATVAKIATTEAIGTDRGDIIVAAMIEALRTRGILLPAPTILQRIDLASRARARKQAHQNLVEGLEHPLCQRC